MTNYLQVQMSKFVALFELDQQRLPFFFLPGAGSEVKLKDQQEAEGGEPKVSLANSTNSERNGRGLVGMLGIAVLDLLS